MEYYLNPEPCEGCCNKIQPPLDPCRSCDEWNNWQHFEEMFGPKKRTSLWGH